MARRKHIHGEVTDLRRAAACEVPKQKPWWERFAPLLLIVAAVLLYHRAADFATVTFDDPEYVEQSLPAIKGLCGESIAWAFGEVHHGLYIPLTWLSYALDTTFMGNTAQAHHVVNVLLHALNTALLYAFLRRAAGSTWRAVLVAALWAVHPLRVESVAWIAERKDVLATFFALLALLAYLQVARRGRWVDHLWPALLFALSLLAKPMLATLPALLLVLDYWPLQRFSRPRDLPRLLVEKIPLIVLGIAGGLGAIWAQSGAGAMASVQDFGPGARGATALYAYSQYLWHTLWPEPLAVFYPRMTAYPALVLAAGAVAIAGISLLVLKLAWAGHRAPVVGWLWFLGVMLPMSGLLQNGSAAWTDHFSYVPAMGLSILVVWLVPTPRAKFLLPMAGVVGLVLVTLGYLTVRQVETWRDSETLWRHELSVAGETDVGHLNLGVHYYRLGRFDEAAVLLTRATVINPALSNAWYNLGLAKAQLGLFEEAFAALDRAIACPDSPDRERIYRRARDGMRDLVSRAATNPGPQNPLTPGSSAGTSPAARP